MQECAYTQTHKRLRYWVSFVWMDYTSSLLSSRLSLPSSSHFPQTLSLAAVEVASRFLSLLYISFKPARLSSFFYGLTAFFLLFSFFLPLPCPDTNFHTQIQGNVRNVFAPAASCCCCTYDCNPRTWGVWAFIQSPWMDGWMDAGVEWLMKKWGSVGPPLQNSLHNPKTNNNMLIQQGKFSFFLFFYLLRVSQQHPHISCENRSIMIHSYTQTFFKNWQ